MRKLVSIALVLALMFNLFPTMLFHSFVEAGEIDVLTREEAEKFEGMVSAGRYTTVALRADGSVFAAGGNYYQQLHAKYWEDIIAVSSYDGITVGLKSDGTIERNGRNTYSSNTEWKNLIAVSAGNNHVVGLKEDGTVIAEGDNRYGQRNVSDWHDIIAISAGDNYTVGLKSDGTVVAVGDNFAGKKEVDHWEDIVAISAGGSHTLGLKSDGTVVAAGHNQDGQAEVEDWQNIVSISAGESYSVGLKSDGTVVAVGYNYYGQTNVDEWEGIIAIAAGIHHTVGLKSDGTFVAVGNNEEGQLNVENWENLVSVSAGDRLSLGVKSDGTVVAAGEGVMGNKDVMAWREIVQAESGVLHTVGLKADGTVVATGYNEEGQTDVSDWQDIKEIAASGHLTLGLKNDGTVLATGANYYGEANVTDWDNIKSIVTSGMHTVGLKNDGTVVAVGDNDNGKLETEDWSGIVSIAVSDTHTMGLKSDGTVVMTSYLGDGGRSSEVSKWQDIIDISVGRYHAVGLKSDGTVVAVGNYSAYNETDVGNWEDIVSIATSYHYTIGLKRDGTAVAVGMNEAGRTEVHHRSNEIVSVESDVVQPNETVSVNVKNSVLYNVDNDQYELTGSASYQGVMENDGDTVRKIVYEAKESDIGHVSVVFPGIKDAFGNPLVLENVFDVTPLKAVTASANSVRTGDVVTVTAEFYKPVMPGVKVSLNGAQDTKATEMIEVPGSNGTKYTSDYVIDGYKVGSIHAVISNINSDDLKFRSYKEENIFEKNNQVPPVVSITSSVDKAKIGDGVTIVARFSEEVKSDFTLSLDTEEGAYTETNMTEVQGSNGKIFTYTFGVMEGESGELTARITNLYNAEGKLFDEFVQLNLLEVDGIKPFLSDIEVIGESYPKLGDEFEVIATFNEPIKPGMKLSLSGGINQSDITMTEVAESNGTKYSYRYTVKEGELGHVRAVFSGIEDLAGNKIPAVTKGLLSVDGIKPNVVTVETDKDSYENGDIAHIVITFSETVQPDFTVRFTGAVEEEYEMNYIDGKTYELYYEIPADKFGFVGFSLQFQDEAGNMNTFEKSKGLYMSDPSNANLTDISLEAKGTKVAMTPDFSPDIFEYRVTVSDSVKTIKVDTTTEDKNTTVSGIGSHNIELGENIIEIVSSSKNGTVKTYKLIIMSAEENIIAHGRVTASNFLNVRGGPSTSYQTVGRLYSGDVVAIVGEEGYYYRIKLSDGYGYASKSLVSKLNGATSEGKITSNVNVRQGPSGSTAKVGYLIKGTKVEIFSKEGSYYLVKLDDRFGYVYSPYVELQTIAEARVTSKGLNVRKGPSGNTAKVGYFANGAIVEIVGKEGSYYHIKLENGYGYVYAPYVKEFAERLDVTLEGRIISNVNVRQGPSSSTAKVHYFTKGSKVQIVSKVGSYYIVKLNNGYGYVYGSYVKEMKAVIAEGQVTSKGLNVRQGPSSSTKKIGNFSKDAIVEIVGKQGSYYEVKINNGYGYVYAPYVKEFAERLAVTSKGSIASNVNVRQGPSGSTIKVGYLPKGTKVEIVHKKGSYYLIKLEDGYGYVYAPYVKI